MNSNDVTAELLEELRLNSCNWGRWGPEDQIGTLNFITAEKVVQASALIRQGKVFSLALPFDSNGPQYGRRGRVNPIHFMTSTGADYAVGRQRTGTVGVGSADGTVVLPLQAGTQWDGLSHMFRDGKMWNGYPADLVTAAGAGKNDVCNMKDRVVSRGILLDIPRVQGVDALAPGKAIYPDDLDRAAELAGVAVECGDIVLVRTGDMGRRLREQRWGDYAGGDAPGLSVLCIPWLYEKQVAGLATDTWSAEVRPNEAPPGIHQPLHLVGLINMGLLIGEIFFLDDLAADCAADGICEFFFVAPPLPITGAVASPVNPQAIK